MMEARSRWAARLKGEQPEILDEKARWKKARVAEYRNRFNQQNTHLVTGKITPK